MGEFDLLIVGGRVASASGVYEADVGVTDGVIAAIGKSGSEWQASEVIDAEDRVILPGVIDPHVHMRDPGKVEREDWITGSRAAASGGVTTLLDHPNTVPPVNSAASLQNKREIISEKSLVDFGLYGGSGAGNLEGMFEQAEAGAVAFKTFLWPYPDRKDEFEGLTCLDDRALLEVFSTAAEVGLPQGVHAENRFVIQYHTDKLGAAQKKRPSVHGESRPVIAEVEAVSRAIMLAAHVGTRLYLPHISCGSVAAVVKQAKQEGSCEIIAETCTQYLFLTEQRLEEIGPYAKVNPPLRSVEEQEKLWEHVLDGTIDTLGSDHAPNLPEQIELGWDDIFAAPAGRPAVETALPLMLTAVNESRIDLPTVVRLMCENPAKAYGLYPKKGAVQVGSDADVVLVDMDRRGTLRLDRMYTKRREAARMFDGRDVVGLPMTTLVRGTVVFRDGEIIGQPGHGEFVRPLKVV